MNLSNHGRRALALTVGLALAAAVGAQTAAPAAKSAAPPAKKAAPAAPRLQVEPRALELLKASAAKLAAAPTLAFTAVVSHEHPSRYGPPVVTTTRYDVTLQRPNQLRVLSPGDGPVTEFYYDGTSMLAYLPAANLAAVTAAPATLQAALDQAFKTADIYFPFEDLLLPDPYAALAKGALLAFTLGPSGVVGGVKTESVVWANKDVFMQIWLGAEDGLPRRFRAIYAADPKQLRYDMELSNWQLGAPLPATHFTSAPAQTARKIAFAKPALPPAPVLPVKKKPAAPTRTQSQ
jgi:hypothetical protein